LIKGIESAAINPCRNRLANIKILHRIQQQLLIPWSSYHWHQQQRPGTFGCLQTQAGGSSYGDFSSGGASQRNESLCCQKCFFLIFSSVFSQQ
jgi:hypothetical protein|tara:strand:+ start:58 stop:336 length:279 start_codon:yes stop_codon:yes gene_type:complete